MADGLLLTRKERIRSFWARFAAGVGPALAVAVVALAIGGDSAAWAIAIFGTLIGLVVASSARTARGALIGGLVVAGLLIAFQIVVAWFFTHPIVPGS
jgi:hypothetical protein